MRARRWLGPRAYRGPGQPPGVPSAPKCGRCAGSLWLQCSSLALLVAGVALVRAGHRELAELVPDHVLVDQHRHVLAAVVDGDGQTDHLRQDHRTTRPGVDRTLVIGGNGGFHLLYEVQVNERTFL